MFVTASVAASLDAQGRLLFDDTITIGVPERVNFGSARDLALAFIRQRWSTDMRHALEQ